jgi:hypothetical protein
LLATILEYDFKDVDKALQYVKITLIRLSDKNTRTSQPDQLRPVAEAAR